MWLYHLRSHGCSWPIRNVTLFRSFKFRIRTWYVYKHIHLYACIFEANFSFMHSSVNSEDVKRTNDAMKTCDYQVPNCFWPRYFVDDAEKNQREQGYSTSAVIGFLIWYTRYCFLALIKEKKCHSTKWYIGCSQQFYFKEEIRPRNTPKIHVF